jgi:hypothetical protein
MLIFLSNIQYGTRYVNTAKKNSYFLLTKLILELFQSVLNTKDYSKLISPLINENDIQRKPQ